MSTKPLSEMFGLVPKYYSYWNPKPEPEYITEVVISDLPYGYDYKTPIDTFSMNAIKEDEVLEGNIIGLMNTSNQVIIAFGFPIQKDFVVRHLEPILNKTLREKNLRICYELSFSHDDIFNRINANPFPKDPPQGFDYT